MPRIGARHWVYSYGHVLVITGYKWDYTIYKWDYKYLYNWSMAITVVYLNH